MKVAQGRDGSKVLEGLPSTPVVVRRQVSIKVLLCVSRQGGESFVKENGI